MANTSTRSIGDIEEVPIPEGKALGGNKVWKDALEPLEVGQSRLVSGVKIRSLEQSVMKTRKAHFPERKFKVWPVYEDAAGEGAFRVGRVE